MTKSTTKKKKKLVNTLTSNITIKSSTAYHKIEVSRAATKTPCSQINILKVKPLIVLNT